MKKNQYEYIYNLAFSISKKYLDDYDIAKDMAQLVLVEFHFNEKQIIDVNNWVFTVAKNKALNYNKKNKREQQMISNIAEQPSNLLNVESDSDNLLSFEFIDSLKLVPDSVANSSEKKLLLSYYNNKCDINQIAIGRDIVTVRKRIYRIKSEIIAWNNIRNGVRGTKLIVGDKLNRSINNFIKSFKKNMKENTLGNMTKYFLECKIPDDVPDLKIKSIIEYSIDLVEKEKYRLWVHYFDESDQFRSFITEFVISNSKSLRITKFPKPPLKIDVFDIEDVGEDFLQQISPNSKGENPYSKAELEELLESKGVRLKTIFSIED